MRNHSMPLEALRYEVTPLGLHYLLIHFDIPVVDAGSYELRIGGGVRRPLRLTMDDIRSRPATTLAVTLECAGNGRARLSPRPMSQPWLTEAVGTAEWTGASLAPGVPDFMTRTRYVEPSLLRIEGRAWSGRAPVVRVEFSADGGSSWSDAALEEAPSRFAWRRWTCAWDATESGEYELCARATDAAGNTQPVEQAWNLEGVQNNGVQRVRVIVGEPDVTQSPADSLR